MRAIQRQSAPATTLRTRVDLRGRCEIVDHRMVVRNAITSWAEGEASPVSVFTLAQDAGETVFQEIR